MHEEITKHTKKIYNEARNAQHSFGEKLRSIVVEIFIIVFAVTISIWLHNWSEHRHQQKEVKEFLADLKEDVNNDIASLKSARDTMKKNSADFLFIQNLTKQQYDSLYKVHGDIHMNARIATIIINTGNYEGFKSSGKIGYIENKELKNGILDYYEKMTPLVTEMDKASTAQAYKVIGFYMENNDAEDPSKILLATKFKAMIAMSTMQTNGCIELCDLAINYANQVIKEIDKQAGK